METQLIAAIAIFVLLFIYKKLTDHMRAKGIPIPGEDEEAPPERGDDVFTAARPHLCAHGSAWMPTSRTRAMKIGERKPVVVAMSDPSGSTTLTSVPAELGVVICEGVFCSACSQRLVCRCGATPVRDTVLEDREAERRVLSCCENPFFVESDVPGGISPLAVGRHYGGKGIAEA